MAKKKKRKCIELNKNENRTYQPKLYRKSNKFLKNEKKHHICGDKNTKQPQVHEPPGHLAWLRNRTRGISEAGDFARAGLGGP